MQFFLPTCSTENLLRYCENQIRAVQPIAQHGIQIEIRPHRKPRTFKQNRFLMEIMQHIVRFYHETGFKPDNIHDWCMRTDVLKEFFKARFAVKSTTKLSTKEFIEFTDNIQRMMQEQSHGEYIVLDPEESYYASLAK